MDSRGQRVVRGLTYAVLLVLTAQVTVAGAVLLLWRPGGVPVPIGIAVALLVGPACWAGASLLGRRAGAAGPGLVWLVLVLSLLDQRREGDLVIQSDLAGLAFLLVGTLAASVCTGAWTPGATRWRSAVRCAPNG